MTKLVSIWDLDGTLVNCQHRLPHILKNKPDWPKFHSLTHADTLYPHAAILYNALKISGILPILCTGRSETARSETQLWLETNEITDYFLLLMRADNDHRKAEEVKKNLLEFLQTKFEFNVIMAFEDQPSVVEMYREAGVPVWAADDVNWRNGNYIEKSTKPPIWPDDPQKVLLATMLEKENKS